MKKVIITILVAVLFPLSSHAIGVVNTVSSPNGTLLISPHTGIVTADLNLINENYWEGAQTFYSIKWNNGNFFLFEDGTINSKDGVNILDAAGNIKGNSLLVDHLQLKSPNGTCFEETISNAAVPSFATTTCL